MSGLADPSGKAIRIMTRRNFFLCYFETTRKCNLSCSYCMTRRPGRPDDGPARSELTTDEAKHLVLDEVKKICPNGSVAFSGGEFLLRPDALEMLRYNNSIGLYSFINTNGKCLNGDLLKDIKRAAGDRITMGFSLDSIDDGIHQRTRADKPSEILKLLELCDRHKIGYFFLVTVTKSNLPKLAETVDFLKSRNIAMIRSPFVPRGAGQENKHLAFDRSDMEQVIHPALKDNHLSYVSFTPFFAGPEFMARSWRGLDMPLANLGCQAGRGFIGVSAEGDVGPCVHLLDTSLDCGNVRNQPLSQLMETNPIMASLRDGSKLKGKCGRCRYKHTCTGCRALAYYQTGDYLAEDPSCFFEPQDEHTVSEHEETHNRNVSRFLEFIIYNKPWNQIFQPPSLWSRLKILARLAAKPGNTDRL
ncbi:MAG: radical SAM protein [Planctomycetota bacterium]